MSKLIYLDNSATSFPKPDVVYDFMNDFYRKHGVNPGRSGFDAAVETEEVVNSTRKMLTKLFNGGNDHNRLTFSYNATDSLNLIINGLVEKGIHVVSTMLEHNSVLRPLNMHHQNGTIDLTSQGAGAVDLDMQESGIDVYCFTGHKCLMGPTGIGGSYVREGIEIKHTRAGGTGVRSAYPVHLDEYPYRLEYGTLNLLGVAGLNAGVKWIQEQGIMNIHHREILLWDKLRKALQDIEGVTTYCASSIENQNPVLSFNINGFDSGDVGTMLDVDYNIAVRTGLQCAPKVHEVIGTFDLHGTVRMSIGAFTTEEDVNTAIEAVKEIAAIRN